MNFAAQSERSFVKKDKLYSKRQEHFHTQILINNRNSEDDRDVQPVSLFSGTGD